MFRAKAVIQQSRAPVLEVEEMPGQVFIVGPETYCVFEEKELTDQRRGDWTSGMVVGVFAGMLLVALFFYLEKWIGR